MRPIDKENLKARLNSIAPEGRDPAIHTVIDVLEAIIDALPEDKQPRLKPKGPRRGTNP